MIIHVYESETAPADQRFVAMAQYEKHLFAFQHGSTADDARDRMQTAIDKIAARDAKRKPKVEQRSDAETPEEWEDLLG